MIFTVTYLPDAENELFRLYLDAADKQAITQASNEIDRLLRVDAHLRGQPFFGDRILRVEPLAVVYSVSEDDRLAQVNQVLVISP